MTLTCLPPYLQVVLRLAIPRGQNMSKVFSVSAVDESGNIGHLSNLVTVGFGFIPDVTTSEYLQYKQGRGETDSKEPPSQQKKVIAGVVGSVVALLVATVIVTLIVQVYQMSRRRESREQRYQDRKATKTARRFVEDSERDSRSLPI